MAAHEMGTSVHMKSDIVRFLGHGCESVINEYAAAVGGPNTLAHFQHTFNHDGR